MTATNHDDQRHNLVKFIQRYQMSLTLLKRRFILREIAQMGQFTPCARKAETRVHEKALADFHKLWQDACVGNIIVLHGAD